MREALHPFGHNLIDPPRYWLEFGRKPLDKTSDARPRARCSICKQEVFDRGGRTGEIVSHFAHITGQGFCPTKEPAGKPYLELSPRFVDQQNAISLRKIFSLEWIRYFNKLRGLVPCLSADEFVLLVGLANKYRIWEYARLSAWEIPYVFLMLADFPVKTSLPINGKPARKFWFRFWYDPKVRNIEDLWINKPEEVRFFRASYNPPARGGMPRAAHLVYSREIVRDRNFLDESDELKYPMAHKIVPRALQQLLPDAFEARI